MLILTTAKPLAICLTCIGKDSWPNLSRQSRGWFEATIKDLQVRHRSPSKLKLVQVFEEAIDKSGSWDPAAAIKTKSRELGRFVDLMERSNPCFDRVAELGTLAHPPRRFAKSRAVFRKHRNLLAMREEIHAAIDANNLKWFINFRKTLDRMSV